ncbi:MAG: hypothetical protein Q9M22_02605 [Mariprofundaceae bacterium]|nr:hypothetical protein [Mariprofundaceae bacterium]
MLFRVSCLVLLVVLAGCLQSAQQFVPASLLQQLEGKWSQVSGTGKLTFYNDESVKISLPEHQPPIKLLTHLEAIKDGIVLNLGERWERPALLEYDAELDTLKLGFVADDGETVTYVHFVRKSALRPLTSLK